MRHRPFGQVVVGGLTAIVHALSFLCPWNAVGIPTGDRHHMWTAAVSTDGTGGSWVSMARQTNSTAAAADHQEHDGPGGGLWAAVHSYKVGPFCRCGVKDNCPLCCQCAGENMTEVPKELPSSLQTL